MSRVEEHPPANIGALSRRLRDLSVAALVTNNVGTYVITNAAASRLTGYSGDELCRMSVWDVSPATNDRETDVLWRHFVHAGVQRGIVQLKTKRGLVVRARYVARSHILPGVHISLLRRTK
jgi:PAS domain S-box-containing protein